MSGITPGYGHHIDVLHVVLFYFRYTVLVPL